MSNEGLSYGTLGIAVLALVLSLAGFVLPETETSLFLFSVGTTDVSTSSTSPVDMPQMTITFTLDQATNITARFTAGVSFDGTSNNSLIAFTMLRTSFPFPIYLAGTTIGMDSINSPYDIYHAPALSWAGELPSGTHTLKVQWQVYFGTGTIYCYVAGAPPYYHRCFIIEEF